MTPPFSKRWLHPQAVPRGFLRLYILTLISRGPQTGSSITHRIEEKTEDAWRPGPGTMYPLLKGLVSEGLVKASEAEGRRGTKTYTLTAKGRKELDEVRSTMAGAGRKEPVMARLFSDLLPGELFLQMVLRRYREGSDTFQRKLGEVPSERRGPILRELKLMAEEQLRWIDSEMSALPEGAMGSKPSSRRKL